MRKRREIFETLLNKNRTIVSRGYQESLEFLAQDYPIEVESFPSGSEYGSWVVPLQWEVQKATLSDKSGIIASYEESPLFLAPYSKNFQGWVDREELEKHLVSNPELPDCFTYEFRLGTNFQRRLKDWVITIPHRRREKLNDSSYYVDIQVEVSEGQMLIGESRVEGENPSSFVFLSHLCHPAQLNDGLAGVVMGKELMEWIRITYQKPRNTYKHLIFPETVGSAIYTYAHRLELDRMLGSIFFEMPAWKGDLELKESRRGNTYLDRLMTYSLNESGIPYRRVGFYEKWGNDELIFDYPGNGVPGLGLQHCPFPYYHSSHDNIESCSEEAMEQMLEVMKKAVSILEKDGCVQFRDPNPPYLTRYGLYTDFSKNHDGYKKQKLAIDMAWEGKSILDIALDLEISFDELWKMFDGMMQHQFLSIETVSPEYTRKNKK